MPIKINSSTDTASHHGEYYITGADLIVRVQDTLFRIHRYFFLRESAHFRSKLPHAPSPGDSHKGSSDNNPLVLDDALKVDFERFLWVFYNPKYSLYDATLEEWTSILKLAHQWGFSEVKALAVRELENLGVPPLQKIVLYQTYAIDRKLLKPALTALTMRDEPLSIEEGRELSLETALELAKAREIARAPVFTNKKAGNPRSPVNLAGVELDALIKDVFHLPSSIVPEPLTSQTSTGRDTPQPNTQTGGGSNSHQSTTHTNGTTDGFTPNGTLAPKNLNIFNKR
ncbi:hypothetical protein DFH94DRAFT_690122 [Russula ochroleuca]|jgi:hypothetical protein|uniref:BTB domain-containing protein n=1 Tax=Russula ochroleuca TaxID=152965 RepID=A0A9P5N0W3_9AGAM|nr:hypothetical protein DFH94DRAFT_690122 [Russula ochroleuca]